MKIPIKFTRPKKQQRIIKSTLTEADIVRIIDACKNLREKAIITLLAYSGIRNRELCALKIQNIQIHQRTVQIIKGKGQRDRLVCISGSCCELLAKYLYERGGESDDYIFITIRNHNQLQPQDLRKLVRIVAARAQLHKKVHPHLFRHSLATNMLNRGANIMTIKEQLGHANIGTTMIYVHSSQQRLQAEYQMFTPSYM